MGRHLAPGSDACAFERTAKEPSRMSPTVYRKRRARKPPVAVRASAGEATTMTAKELIRVGELLYGARFQTELAAALNVSLRALIYMTAGERPIRQVARDRLRELVAVRRLQFDEVARWL